MTSPERQLEDALVEKLRELKYEYRPDIRDRATLEKNFRQKFAALNHVQLTDAEFQRILEKIITLDVFSSARTLRERNSFTSDDGTPLNFTLVNIKDWCKNSFEVVNQLQINIDNSHHRYDVILLINGVPAVQIELKILSISPRRAMTQIVDYKNEPGNGDAKPPFASFNSSSSATVATPGILRKTTLATSPSISTSVSCPSFSTPSPSPPRAGTYSASILITSSRK